MSVIGDRMRELRGSSSLREMAEAIGIKFNAWARYEAGGSIPGGEIIERICRVHACSADWLLGLTTRGGSATANGDGAIAAAGSNIHIEVGKAPVKTSTPGEMAACRKCPCKRLYDAVQKAQKSLQK